MYLTNFIMWQKIIYGEQLNWSIFFSNLTLKLYVLLFLIWPSLWHCLKLSNVFLPFHLLCTSLVPYVKFPHLLTKVHSLNISFLPYRHKLRHVVKKFFLQPHGFRFWSHCAVHARIFYSRPRSVIVCVYTLFKKAAKISQKNVA